MRSPFNTQHETDGIASGMAGLGPPSPSLGSAMEPPSAFANAFAGTAFSTGRAGVLNIQQLASALASALDGSCVGYQAQLRVRGDVRLNPAWGYARKPDDGDKAWTSQTPMHIASLSKLFTAFALGRLLDDAGISIDDRISDWLPPSWPRGSRVDEITFSNLLAQTSGLNYGDGLGDGTEISPADIGTMRKQIARGVPHLGKFAYRNVNYSLCRILMLRILDSLPPPSPIDAGMPHVHTTLPDNVPDNVLDAASITAYTNYLQTKIFQPAGATDATFEPPANAALMYSFPAGGQQAPGNESAGAGSDGWFMSVDDVGLALHAIRMGRAGPSVERVEELMRFKLGFDRIEMTDIGLIYAKGGYWSKPDPDWAGEPALDPGCVNLCSAFLMPGDMELIVFINSQLISGDVQDVVFQAIASSISPIAPIVVTEPDSGLADAVSP